MVSKQTFRLQSVPYAMQRNLSLQKLTNHTYTRPYLRKYIDISTWRHGHLSNICIVLKGLLSSTALEDCTSLSHGSSKIKFYRLFVYLQQQLS